MNEKSIRNFARGFLLISQDLDGLIQSAMQMFGKYGGSLNERLQHNDEVHRIMCDEWLKIKRPHP